jgi:hypothetical protein
MARVLDVIMRSTEFASKWKVMGSTSPNTGPGPDVVAASPVAKNEFAGTITSSPASIRAVFNASSRAGRSRAHANRISASHEPSKLLFEQFDPFTADELSRNKNSVNCIDDVVAD